MSERPDLYLALRHRYRNLIGLRDWLWFQYAPRIIKQGDDPYDSSFWHNQDPADWREFANLLLKLTQPQSVIDVGCGNGVLLGALKDGDYNLRLLGLDGSHNSVSMARRRGLSVNRVDLAGSSYREIQGLGANLPRFDLAICLEVAEHFPPWHSRKLLRLLTTVSDLIVFSAAHPNQGGTLHVNEQPAEYWVAKFEGYGFHLTEMNQALRAGLRDLDIPSYYKSNIHVFEKSQRETEG